MSSAEILIKLDKEIAEALSGLHAKIRELGASVTRVEKLADQALAEASALRADVSAMSHAHAAGCCGADVRAGSCS